MSLTKRMEYKGQLDILMSGRFSDFEVECSGKTFPVHRAIIAAHSEYFNKLLDSTMSETTARSVKLDDVDAGVFGVALVWMYTKTLPPLDFVNEIEELIPFLPDTAALDERELMLSARLCVLADRIIASDLGKAAHRSLRRALMSTDTASAYSVEEFINAANMFYSTEHFHGIQKLIALAVLARVRTKQWPEFHLEEIFHTIPALGWEIYKMRNVYEIKVRCFDCSRESWFLHETYLPEHAAQIHCYCALQGLCSDDCGDLRLSNLRCQRRYELEQKGYMERHKMTMVQADVKSMIWFDGELVSYAEFDRRKSSRRKKNNQVGEVVLFVKGTTQ